MGSSGFIFKIGVFKIKGGGLVGGSKYSQEGVPLPTQTSF